MKAGVSDQGANIRWALGRNGAGEAHFDPSNPRRFLPSHTLTPALHHTYSRMHCTASHMLTPALQRTPILTPALHCRHTYTSRLHCTGMFQVRMHTKAGACSSTDMCLIVHRLLMCSRISGSECVCARERYKIGSL